MVTVFIESFASWYLMFIGVEETGVLKINGDDDDDDATNK